MVIVRDYEGLGSGVKLHDEKTILTSPLINVRVRVRVRVGVRVRVRYKQHLPS